MKKIRILLSSLLVVSITSLTSIGASASTGEWKQDTNGLWWYSEETSWAIGWKLIDEKWYYFNQSTGYMESNTYVDNYYLGSDGAWDGNSGTTSSTKSSTVTNNSSDSSNSGSAVTNNSSSGSTSSTTSNGKINRHSSSNGSIEGSKGQGGAQDKDLGDALNNGHK